MRREERRIRLFPEYFDRDLSRKEGRRLPKNKSIKNPNLLELKIAAQKMDLETETNNESSHPAFPTNKRGMLIVTIPEEYPLNKLKMINRLSELTVSYARPLIEEKKKKILEEKSEQKKKFKGQGGITGQQKGSQRSKKGPKPRRR